MTTQVRNIYQRMNQVMTEVEAVQKESKKVNGMYTFVSHDAVSKALHMPMVRNGIVMLPTIEELTQDGNRTRVMMGIHFVNMDNPEDKCYVRSAGDGIDPQDKGIGKAISYAVKYGMLKAFCLETGDDVEKDSYEYVPPVKKIETEPRITEEQCAEVTSLINERDVDITKMMQALNIKSLKEIHPDNLSKIIKALKMKPMKQKIEYFKGAA